MLQALELIGFKSFADKTRFEFPPGITVIVGPNGSGKSNIVDAIKWVLGEQSAKSLRGKDMSDVIFKGAGNLGRKPMNTAEATIVIDNAEGRLPVDAPEVHVTRRVYRSGEGEYLINREPCRLKDIRDMFRGTGVGTDAYSLIEQGKVDRLLQASPKDRRAIFEEAAGISRFKAKKLEALRRLARVDQNLLRLSDIVDEVDSRLRSVRSQAAKARRYREYTDRLQQLRTQVGQSDWRRLTEKLNQIEAELTRIRDRAQELTAKAEADEAHLLELDTHLTECGERAHRCEHQDARNREQIAARESTIQQERRRSGDLEHEAARYRVQLASMTGRAGYIQQRLEATTCSLEEAEREYQRVRQQVDQHQHALQTVTADIDQMHSQTEQQRAQYAERMRNAAQLANQVGGLQSRLEGLQTSQRRCASRLAELQPALEACLQEQSSLQERAGSLEQESADLRQQLENLQSELKHDRRLVSRRQDELVEIQGHLSGCRKRADVLEELERKREGLSAGARQILEQASASPTGALADLLGVVADLIQADMEIAPLVDVALGPAAQRVVVHGGRLTEQLRRGELPLQERVSFIRGDTPAARRESDRNRLDGLPGVIGRADRMVRYGPRFALLVNKLLGDVWFVESLTDAFRLQQLAGRGPRFVTAQGELLEPDGSCVVGPLQAAAGLVSRKSELQSLHSEIRVFAQRLEHSTSEIQRLRENIEQKEQQAERLVERYQESRSGLAELRARQGTLQQQIERAEVQVRSLRAEAEAAREEGRQTSDQLDQCRQRLVEVDRDVQQLETQVHENEQRLRQAELRRQQHLSEVTEAKVELAKSDQQVKGLRARLMQFEEDQKERTRAIDEAQNQLAAAGRRRQVSELDILRGTSELAELFLSKEGIAAEIERWRQQQVQIKRERTAVSKQIQSLRKKLHQEEELQHQKELEAGEARHERNAMAQRLREDYGIEISELEQPVSAEALLEREQVEEEIQSLRRKISNIGAVNMEALDELDDLETRHHSLASQFQDLSQAKDSLERIIHKINGDSRRLFVETLEAIRANFQVLYRKAFGGGKADIVLEEGEDVLEAGIEIIATPPGKPSFNNSLLSGGEKALTAVSLLLAIFQYRPSPFCVLDEVDAPFDEANIGRFVDVLREFLGWTKFVIVTHSKKTMTAATTLYGVTMQESGVSKQVSVRFDDVTDDGHIKPEALQRDAAGDDERAA